MKRPGISRASISCLFIKQLCWCETAGYFTCFNFMSLHKNNFFWQFEVSLTMSSLPYLLVCPCFPARTHVYTSPPLAAELLQPPPLIDWSSRISITQLIVCSALRANRDQSPSRPSTNRRSALLLGNVPGGLQSGVYTSIGVLSHTSMCGLSTRFPRLNSVTM